METMVGSGLNQFQKAIVHARVRRDHAAIVKRYREGAVACGFSMETVMETSDDEICDLALNKEDAIGGYA